MKKLFLIVFLLILISGCVQQEEQYQEEPTSERTVEVPQYQINPCSPHMKNLTQQADLIFHNGTVLTIDSNFSLTQAVAVKDKRILATDCNENILSLRGNETKVINLGGKALLPGFIDGHQHLIFSSLIEDRFDGVQDIALSNGYTSIAEMGVNPMEIEEMLQIEEDGLLRLRVNVFENYNLGHFDEEGKPAVMYHLDSWYLKNDPILDHDRMLRIPGVKIFADGAGLPERGCPALIEPYPETARSKTFYESCRSEYGDLYFSQDELNQIVAKVHDRGYRAAFHAMGDRAIDTVINAIEFALDGEPNELHRHQIQHNSLIGPDLLKRYAELDILAALRGYFKTCGLESYIDYYGPERYQWAANRYALVPLGVHVYLETDSGYINPMINLYGLVTRQYVNEDGSVCKPEPWVAKHQISIEEALRIMTIEPAYAVSQEDVLGTLEAGKFADIVILSENPLEVDPDEIKDIEVWMTMVGGKTEYCAEGHENLCP
ncbi:MAG: amidohydrolase family protein [Candidatus Aenigmatarchaeota archaeon]|nr:MAG: amidohydrolase family protein [Candidatus Aenigmarchaeota archaeon]